jgi:ATP-dependent Zn protease
LTYSEFLQQVRTGQVASVVIDAKNSGAVHATCSTKYGKTVRTVLPADYADALKTMQERLVNIEIRDSFSEPLRLLRNATPFLLLLGVWIFLIFCKFRTA